MRKGNGEGQSEEKTLSCVIPWGGQPAGDCWLFVEKPRWLCLLWIPQVTGSWWGLWVMFLLAVENTDSSPWCCAPGRAGDVLGDMERWHKAGAVEAFPSKGSRKVFLKCFFPFGHPSLVLGRVLVWPWKRGVLEFLCACVAVDTGLYFCASCISFTRILQCLKCIFRVWGSG